jgi:16S rRNA (cytidine1402-2'-O)-methyltransferase
MKVKDLPPLTPGTLYLVATPIGNLEDITLRALRVLRECDLVAAEDTRRTAQLLQAFQIKKPLVSYFKFNEAKRSEEIIQRLRNNEKIALVTDAGTPGISDPGERVVSTALAAGCRVESVPGPCAFVAALTASGLPTEEIHFVGFLPHKSGQRLKKLERLQHTPGTIVLYESPYRVGKLLTELAGLMPERRVVLARELTKKFEEYLRGTAPELLKIYDQRTPKGEFVVLVAPLSAPQSASEPPNRYTLPIPTVGALIYNAEGKVLMIRTHKWSDLWGIPGGKIQFGESAHDALRREVKEETGLDISEIRFVLAQDCIDSKEFHRAAHFILLNYTCRTDAEDVRLNDEAEEFQWIDPVQASELPLNTPTRILLDAVLRMER